MPDRGRGKLLAGIGALLGVCVAAGGCQSLPYDALSSDSGVGILRPVAYSEPAAEPPAAAGAAPATGSFNGATVTKVHRIPEGSVVTEKETEFATAAPGFFNGPIFHLRERTAHGPVLMQKDAEVQSAWRPMVRTGSDPQRPGESGWIRPVQAQQVAGGEVQPVANGDAAPMPRGTAELPAAEPAPAPRVEGAVVVAPPGHLHPSRTIAALPVPREFEKQPMPPYRIEPPDILLIRASRAITLPTQPLDGQHLVRMDGFVNLGIYGEVFLAGRSLEEARDLVAIALLARRVKGRDPKDLANPNAKDVDLTVEDIKRELQVDVLAYNSKFYFIVIDGGGYGERVFRVPFTGNETVLDAMSMIGGLPDVSSRKNMWIARATPADAHPHILPIDWRGITQAGNARTNYQVFPYDRIYVKADLLIKIDQTVGKVIAPAEKLLGVTLLGASTVNTIRSGANNAIGGTGATGR
jgi:polysaccharide export outer membrane protein